MTVKNLRTYFDNRKPSGAITAVVIGLFFLWIGVTIEGGALWAFIGVFMVVGGTYFIAKFKAIHSDKAIDSFCDNKLKQYCETKNVVIESVGKDIADVVYSRRYCFENCFSARRAVRGRDSVWRSSVLEMSCAFFSCDRIYYYSKKISLITDEQFEQSKDFDFADIRMVSLEEINHSFSVIITIPGNEKIHLHCQNREKAIELCDKVKNKYYKGEHRK